MRGRAFLTTLLMAGGMAVAGTAQAGDRAGPAPRDGRAADVKQDLTAAARELEQGDLQGAAMTAAESGVEHLLPGLGGDLPGWAQRTEIEWGVTDENKPRYSILTVQPLYESADKTHTVFTQVSQRRYGMVGEMRDVTNAGLGYRRTLFDHTVLVGVNSFFDYEWDYDHRRVSVGGEVKWSGLDLNVNQYWALSDATTIDSAGTLERALDGQDVKLTAQVPYLPWARVSGRRFWWETEATGEDIEGWEAATELDLHQNLQVEAGIKHDNFMPSDDEQEAHVSVRYVMNFGRPVAASRDFVADTPWNMRDMRKYRLDRVERQNRIIVERESAGIVIARGN